MALNLKKMAVFAVAAATFAIASSAAQAGAWSSQGYGGTMYQTNWLYWGTVIQPVGSIPATATISSVSWNVSSSSHPYNSSKRYRVCHNTKTGACVDSASAATSTNLFNGFTANKPFQIGTSVQTGSTISLTPTINVGTEQILVNYNY